MLRIIQNSSPAGAKSYYTTADYYSEGQELRGLWRGAGAEQLGLTGTVGNDEWAALCDNKRPDGQGTLTARQKEGRRVGYDFNFHVPKSVSLLYALTENSQIMEAFQDSVHETMLEMESEAKARIRKSGQNQDRTTGNLLWGEFVHLTARPEDGVPDPHLHAHCFVFNATYDHEENRWKAAQLGDIKRDAPYFEAVFHAKLARKMEELGLETERTATGWELAGIDRETLISFSRRTARIEQLAEAKGITHPELKDELGARSRAPKAAGLSMPELQELWRSRLADDETRAIDIVADRIGGPATEPEPHAAETAVNRAVADCFERASVRPERMFLAEALKQGTGKASRDAVEAFASAQELVRAERNGRTYVTTHGVLDEESKMLSVAREGRGRCRPINPAPRAFTRDWLNTEQRAAVQHVLGSRDKVMVIRGVAGAGKTSALQELREAVEATGTSVHAFAPSAPASRHTLRKEGFASADTVALLLMNETLQREIHGSLVLIDEAGLIGTKTMRSLLELTDREEARIVLVGDTRQHSSVERGSALRMLEQEAGLQSAEIKDIQRQKGEYKKVVTDLSEGRTEDGVRRLDDLGWIREVQDGDRERALADSYLNTVRSGKTALIVSPTHAEGARITREIRRQLHASGELSDTSRTYERLIPVHLTLGQRQDPTSYQPGDVLVFHQNARGFRKGTKLTLGSEAAPTEQAERFTVFRQSQIELSEGDRIRITKGGMIEKGNHRLENGDLFTVKRFTKDGGIVLNNGWELPRAYGHLTHGYTTTSHASQSRTVDRVFIGQSSMSSRAASRSQFYVSVSRAREQAIVFTDNKDELLEAVQQTDERLSGSQLVADAAREHVARQRVMNQQAQVMTPLQTREREQEYAHAR